MMSIPADLEDFTADWLNKALASQLGTSRVTTCKARLSEVPGQTAEIILIDVDYSEPNDLPTHLVAKIASFNKVTFLNI